jgi:hypothetical protein
MTRILPNTSHILQNLNQILETTLQILQNTATVVFYRKAKNSQKRLFFAVFGKKIPPVGRLGGVGAMPPQ